MNLATLWFVLIAVLWCGFFVLEGFDFGVGALHRVVGHDDAERRVAINTIGPVWDGNEVWLIVAGAAMFAAFPAWYATWFSALYLALLLVLVALIVRGVSFEFRGKSDRPAWRATWSWTLATGSVVAPLLIGVGLGDLLAGLPINADGDFTGGLLDLFTPYGLLFGVTLLVLCLFHGSSFLALKAGQPVRSRAHGIAQVLRWPALVLAIGASAWTAGLAGGGWVYLPIGVAVGGAILAVVAVGRGREGLAFAGTALTILGLVAALFVALSPDVMVSSTDAADNLTIADSSSQQYSLQIITVVAAVALPVVLLYQGWSYLVFRRRVVLRSREEVGSA